MIYNRAGEPISAEEWAKLIEEDTDATYRRVALTELGEYCVSTVWLGLDHGFFGRRLIFETMVFYGENRASLSHNGLFNRYATEAEALAGHQEIVKNVAKLIEIVKKVAKESSNA